MWCWPPRYSFPPGCPRGAGGADLSLCAHMHELAGLHLCISASGKGGLPQLRPCEHDILAVPTLQEHERPVAWGELQLLISIWRVSAKQAQSVTLMGSAGLAVRHCSFSSYTLTQPSLVLLTLRRSPGGRQTLLLVAAGIPLCWAQAHAWALRTCCPTRKLFAASGCWDSQPHSLRGVLPHLIQPGAPAPCCGTKLHTMIRSSHHQVCWAEGLLAGG